MSALNKVSCVDEFDEHRFDAAPFTLSQFEDAAKRTPENKPDRRRRRSRKHFEIIVPCKLSDLGEEPSGVILVGPAGTTSAVQHNSADLQASSCSSSPSSNQSIYDVPSSPEPTLPSWSASGAETRSLRSIELQASGVYASEDNCVAQASSCDDESPHKSTSEDWTNSGLCQSTATPVRHWPLHRLKRRLSEIGELSMVPGFFDNVVTSCLFLNGR